MIIVKSENSRTRIIGKLSNDWSTCGTYHKAIRDALSYEVPNADWSPKFKEGIWDGTISLYNRKEQSFPTGLTSQVMTVLDDLELTYEWQDNRIVPVRDSEIGTAFAENNRTLRWYQTAAVDAAMENDRGVIAVCTGGGKTLIACELIKRMKVLPVVFVVPSISLLKQTKREFEKYIKIDGVAAEIGVAGGGMFNLLPNGINVITYQTALLAFGEVFQKAASKKGKANSIIKDEMAGEKVKKTLVELQTELAKQDKIYALARIQAERTFEQKPKATIEKWITAQTRKELTAYNKAKSLVDLKLQSLERKTQIRSLIESCQAFIVDEAHLAAVIIESLAGKANNAWYKYGTTGTPFREDGQEIRIQGAFGRILIKITASDLIKLGYLVPARIFMVRLKEEYYGDTWAEIYKRNVVDNWERNYRTKQIAEEFHAAGRPVVILVERIEHGKILESIIKDAVFVAGDDNEEAEPEDEELDYRRRMLDACENNENVLIATSWAYTGIDAPKISCLILAGSSQSTVTTYQQTGRVLRTVGPDLATSIRNGKPDAIIIDFYDKCELLRKHANRRRRMYKNEDAFQFQLIGL